MPRAKSVLADPVAAAYALARFRRLLRLMIMAMLGTVLAAATLIYKHKPLGSVRLTIALAIGIALAMLLISGLMARAMLLKGAAVSEDELPQ